MSPSIATTAKNLWKKMASKEYRDSYVAAHISNTVASQIQLLREARGWTQKDLADKSGMGQSRISALEDPNYENIQVGTLKRLASAFDVGLTVRFVPYSEVVDWTVHLTTEKLLVSEFTYDVVSAPAPAPARSPDTTIFVNASTTWLYTGSGVSAATAAGFEMTLGYTSQSITPSAPESILLDQNKLVANV
jgi:transcriptional regulator with XRE-family HTH domain